MTTTVPRGRCRYCRLPIPPEFRFHKACLDKYRNGVPYRAIALTRDGTDCAKCWDWQNRAATRWYAWRWDHTPGWLRHRVRQHREVQVDHIEPLAGEGTHDPTNLQVLCVRHHKRKTRHDVAHLRGRHTSTAAWLVPLLLTAYATALYLAPNAWLRSKIGLLALTLLLGTVFMRWRFRRSARARLVGSLAPITGDAENRIRALRASRWRWRKVSGLRLRRLRPTRIRVRYPQTFADRDAMQQAKVEETIAAKCGGTWSAHWHTQADRVDLISPDPLVALGGIPWPNAPASGLNLWDPIPIGLAENGRTISVSIVERNVLIGGEPGSGKSVGQSIFTATAALDPNARLYGIDGKQAVELGFWRPCMEELVGSGRGQMGDAITLLEHLRDVMDDRYTLLADHGLRKITRDAVVDGATQPLHVLVIDELAMFTTGGTKAERERFVAVLRDVISRGRAAGVIVIAAAQRPSAEVVPTSIRDLIGVRWALRCTTPQSSDMVLGQGWASLGYSTMRVAAEHRGIGIVLAEGGLPVRLRSFHIDDPTLLRLAERAARLRTGRWLEAEPEPREPAQPSTST